MGFIMSGIECVRSLFRSGVRDIDEVAEKCGLTRETARKYLARVRRELGSLGSGDVFSDVELTRRAIELVKSGKAADAADLALQLGIPLKDAEKLFEEIVKAVESNIYVKSFEAARRIVEKIGEIIGGGTSIDDIDLTTPATAIAKEYGLPIDKHLIETITKFTESLRRVLIKVDIHASIRGLINTIDRFIEDPHSFYNDVIRRAEAKNLKHFEPSLITIPCPICGKPMVFTHKDTNWSVVKTILREVFKDWAHIECLRKPSKKPP